ncbi:protein of unknown function [Pseudorhizobium banfieldiae]|uniref:Uncharacterized protein n=1 Tax=Pseudorhizobium banfieldiae TaxID=1125847 RepID=L0NA26_9HYPH|nr:protein of unknown function [Pseudorhizobium banfieldiae]
METPSLPKPPLRRREKLLLGPHPVLEQPHQQHCQFVGMGVVLGYHLCEHSFEQGKVFGTKKNIGGNTATHDDTLRPEKALGKSVW